ncbi:MAG TPA: TlpA disulfide reductase family protein [Bryobacteraceae bacterium]|nr:TlpA disulfide reductase family protein [Bryobacteraceae bacterium]
MNLRCRLLLFAAFCAATFAQPRDPRIAGRWDATIHINGIDTPFPLEITGAGNNVTASFFNGDDPYPSTEGRFENGKLVLKWDYYAATLDATVNDGVIEGQYAGTRIMKGPFAIRATRHTSSPAENGTAPDIDGLWEIPNKSGKGESAWRFIVRQSGANATATILRVDGDTGTISGRYQNGKFVLSHFDGARAHLLQITPAADGTLDILQDANRKLAAYRPAAARAQGLPEPTDPDEHTTMKDPSEPFRFSFPDLNGRLVSSTDARFTGKVLVVEITGSWCPNCHDEAPFLAEMYRKYGAQGLEVVSLSFEEAEQLKDPARLRAFVKRYGLEFPVLLCGQPEEANAKLPQLANWNTWPATLFIDRRGRVRGIHAGFPSPASGDLFRQAKDEFNVEAGRLLAEK